MPKQRTRSATTESLPAGIVAADTQVVDRAAIEPQQDGVSAARQPTLDSRLNMESMRSHQQRGQDSFAQLPQRPEMPHSQAEDNSTASPLAGEEHPSSFAQLPEGASASYDMQQLEENRMREVREKEEARERYQRRLAQEQEEERDRQRQAHNSPKVQHPPAVKPRSRTVSGEAAGKPSTLPHPDRPRLGSDAVHQRPDINNLPSPEVQELDIKLQKLRSAFSAAGEMVQWLRVSSSLWLHPGLFLLKQFEIFKRSSLFLGCHSPLCVKYSLALAFVAFSMCPVFCVVFFLHRRLR